MVDSEGRTTILLWDGEAFTLLLRDNLISDLLTDEDQWTRPTFAGSFDADGQPALSGWVDITPEGNHIVVLYEEPEVYNLRWETTQNGGIVTLATCECSAVYVDFVCESKHCNLNPPPFCNSADTVRCSWIAARVP